MIDTSLLRNTYFFEKGKIPTKEDIFRFIEAKLRQNAILTALDDYYNGKQDILLKPQPDSSHTVNRVVVNYCKIVADFYNSYLLGKPIQYKSGKNELRSEIEAIIKYNDGHDVDVVNNQMSNIMGASGEQLYIDSRGYIRFANVDYRQLIFVYNKDMEQELNCVIKFYKYSSTDPYYNLELWTDKDVTKYRMNEGLSSLTSLGPSESHPFSLVPFVEYINNENRKSSFAPILSMQDAYNNLTSAEIDDYEGFVDSFLGIYNAAGTTNEDISAMKSNRVLLLDGESKAEWIIKNSNPAQIEEIKKDLSEKIHEVASMPDLTDQNFASNASGVAIKYKMVGAESVAAKQERKFKRAIQKRLELIVGYINFVNNTDYNYTDIEIVFTRNMIGADNEICDQINAIYGKVPIKSLASKLSFITDEEMAFVPVGIAQEFKGTNDGQRKVP
jgi:SPP1 family phage portal protein